LTSHTSIAITLLLSVISGITDLRAALSVTTTWTAVSSGPFTIPGLAHGFTYNRSGQIKTLTDPSGSRTLGYENGRLASTAYSAGLLRGHEVIRAHDTTGRNTGATLKRDGAVVHSVEKAPNGVSDQITSLASGPVKVVPLRDNAGRVTGFQWGNAAGNFVPALTQTWQRGPGGRIEYAGSDIAGAPSFDYLLDSNNPGESFDSRGRRLKCETAGGTWTYTYGLNGQLTKAIHEDASDQVILGDFQYAFDAIGRRTVESNPDPSHPNLINLLNQTTAWTHSQPKKLTLTAQPGARVWFNGNEIQNFTGNHQVTLGTPGSTGQWVEWHTFAVLEGAGEGSGNPPANSLADPDAKSEKRGAVWVPPTSETLGYDDAGNRQENALWDYGWDAKNQLVRARTEDFATAPQGLDISFTYDAEGRRVRKHVIELREGERVAEKEITFIWDGWDLLYERHQLPSGLTTLERKYLWGPDILDGAAGGAGGLLLIRETKGNTTSEIIPLYDGTGHVIALTNLNKDLLATYAYGPFGEKISATGPSANTNPWRWGTKYLDEETGLYYFGHRYYDPVTGQWLSREPLGESESVNLYLFGGNDPINHVDVQGLAKVPLQHADQALINLALRYGLINEDVGSDAVIDTAIINSLLTANGESPIVFEMGRTIWPCIVCHGRYAGGHIAGVSRLYSLVNGRVHSSTGNSDMMRKIGAGAWGNTRALPGDIGNLIAFVANGSANAVGELAGVEIGSHPAFYQMPLDADGWRSAGQQQVYPGISGDNLMVGAGGALADAVFLFAGPEALAAKAPGWSVKLAPKLNLLNYRPALGVLNGPFGFSSLTYRLPWSSGQVSRAARLLEGGQTSITLATRSQAEELILRLYHSQGMRNTTGLSGSAVRSDKFLFPRG
jgi:RHS repeat-associated protein